MKQLSTSAAVRPRLTLVVLSTIFLNFEGTVSENVLIMLMFMSFTSTFIGTLSHEPYISCSTLPSAFHQVLKALSEGTSMAPAS